ncbi:hypothetical protein DFH06DRAFT_180676 [Mycena polygramma]|nr:hypothetical protein DFH06DRAFT_180676 [Mycena polygramma]
MTDGESAAHQFICVRELYDLLLMQLEASRQNSYTPIRGPIATLARVSKMTSGPALDLLWFKLTDPSLIIRLLPGDAVQLEQSRQHYTLKRPLKESDLVAFDKYAPRIKFVDFSSAFTSLGGGCELFSTLKTFRNPIFPHLLGMDWHPSPKFNTVGAFHLISRDFNVPRNEFCLTMWRHLNAQDAPYDYAEPTFMTGAGLAETISLFYQPLSSWLPDVPDLSINTGTYLAKPVILEGLQNLSNLQHFHARASGSLGVDILVHLASLPHLKTLHIGEENERTMVTVRNNVSPSFPALESVEIYGTYSAHCEFLPLITSDSLHSACINVTDWHPLDTTITSLLIAPCSRLSTLRHFLFYTPDNAIPETERRPLFAIAAFRPLLACMNLETFDINVDAYKVEFDNADLVRMARAWPRLVSLKVYSRYTQQYGWSDPQVHLYTLWSLVEHCPGLRQIEMAVDARVDGPFPWPCRVFRRST